MMQFEEIDAQLAALTEGASEVKCDSQTKHKISEAIANELNKHVPKTHLEFDHSDLEQLTTNGIVKVNAGLSQDQLLEIRSYLKSIPVFSGHVPAQSDGIRRYLNKGAKEFPFGSYALEDNIQCPHLLELALRPDILSLVEGYLGCCPTIYSMNSWWSFPAFSPAMTQDYHRDVDDYRFLALFVYLTDVNGREDGGQHQFITKTHDEEQVVKLLKNDKERASSLFMPKLRKLGYKQAHVYESLFADQITDITGPAGSIFLADTYALHRGVPPKRGDRLVCWIRYGLRKNLAYRNDKTKPLPLKLLQNRVESNAHTKYIVRLLAAETPENRLEVPSYKVLTDGGVSKANIGNYHWQNVTFSPFEEDIQPATGNFIKDKTKLIRKKILRLLSF